MDDEEHRSALLRRLEVSNKAVNAMAAICSANENARYLPDDSMAITDGVINESCSDPIASYDTKRTQVVVSILGWPYEETGDLKPSLASFTAGQLVYVDHFVRVSFGRPFGNWLSAEFETANCSQYQDRTVRAEEGYVALLLKTKGSRSRHRQALSQLKALNAAMKVVYDTVTFRKGGAYGEYFKDPIRFCHSWGLGELDSRDPDTNSLMEIMKVTPKTQDFIESLKVEVPSDSTRNRIAHFVHNSRAFHLYSLPVYSDNRHVNLPREEAANLPISYLNGDDFKFIPQKTHIGEIPEESQLTQGLPPPQAGLTRLFHATSENSAFRIIFFGIHSHCFASQSDFGQAFYLTPNLGYALSHASRRYPNQRLAVLVYDIESELLASKFEALEGERWAQAMREFRGQRTHSDGKPREFATLDSSKRQFRGAVTANPQRILMGEQPLESPFMQYAVKSPSLKQIERSLLWALVVDAGPSCVDAADCEWESDEPVEEDPTPLMDPALLLPPGILAAVRDMNAAAAAAAAAADVPPHEVPPDVLLVPPPAQSQNRKRKDV